MKEIGIQTGLPLEAGRGVETSGRGKTSGQSFQDLLAEQIREVDGLQKDAARAAHSLATGKTENIHEAMIVLKKAEISFKMMMQVRNKIVKAYEEVMRMQV